MPSLNEIGLLLAVVLLLILFGKWEKVARYMGKMLRRKAGEHVDPQMREWAERMARQQSGIPDDVCYHILGVTPSATLNEIRRAYRRKAKQFHPDHGGDPDIMNALTRAYEHIMAHKQRTSNGV